MKEIEGGSRGAVKDAREKRVKRIANQRQDFAPSREPGGGGRASREGPRRGGPGVIADLKPYAEYKESGLPWLGQVPGIGHENGQNGILEDGPARW